MSTKLTALAVLVGLSSGCEFAEQNRTQEEQPKEQKLQVQTNTEVEVSWNVGQQGFEVRRSVKRTADGFFMDLPIVVSVVPDQISIKGFELPG